MRKSISSKPFATSVGALDITASFGFSVLHKGDITTKREFLDQADQAMYHAKENGRNRVVSYREIEGTSIERNPHARTDGSAVTGEVRS
jgi:PleD family two-component response regulator